MRPVLTSEGVRALDAELEKADLLDLAMEEAGRAVADAAHALAPTGEILLLVGQGANGGDAFVAARHLQALGRSVQVLALPSKHPLTLRNRRRLKAVGIKTEALKPGRLAQALAGAALVVDGLLGSGFKPPLRAELADTVRAVDRAGVPVLAIDLPTGVQAEVSEVEEALRAVQTVALSGLKPALLFGSAAHHAGRVTLADLRLPPGWAERHATATQPDDAEVAALLPVRYADAHKGTAGQVWVIGGHPGTTGAAALAGQGALRGGAGLVTVHSEEDIPLIMPELMVRQHADLRLFPQGVAADERPDALCVGMGLGPDAADRARQVLDWRLPTVLDADALQPSLRGQGHDACVWTPHPGEAARLLECSVAEVSRDPLGAARALQQGYGGVFVLKGGPSTVAHAGGVWVSRGGHPGMASAGMGDTLAGLIAALLGQGMGAADAALAGVTLHARAGERAAQRHGYGLSASDVSLELGAAWRALLSPPSSPAPDLD